MRSVHSSRVQRRRAVASSILTCDAAWAMLPAMCHRLFFLRFACAAFGAMRAGFWPPAGIRGDLACGEISGGIEESPPQKAADSPATAKPAPLPTGGLRGRVLD